MLLHLNFWLEWFDSNSKQDSKSFENAFKYLKRKKRKRVSLPSLAFGPAAQSFPAARLLPCACAILPASPLGPSLANGPASLRERAAAFSSLVSLTP
jgi:hypothetical protein